MDNAPHNVKFRVRTEITKLPNDEDWYGPITLDHVERVNGGSEKNIKWWKDGILDPAAADDDDDKDHNKINT